MIVNRVLRARMGPYDIEILMCGSGESRDVVGVLYSRGWREIEVLDRRCFRTACNPPVFKLYCCGFLMFVGEFEPGIKGAFRTVLEVEAMILYFERALRKLAANLGGLGFRVALGMDEDEVLFEGRGDGYRARVTLVLGDDDSGKIHPVFRVEAVRRGGESVSYSDSFEWSIYDAWKTLKSFKEWLGYNADLVSRIIDRLGGRGVDGKNRRL